MLGVLLAQALEFLVAALHVGDELLDEGAVLDLGEDLLHPPLGVGVDHPRPGQVAAELRGVGHRVVHPRDAALVHQVDDELEFVQHLEVRQLGLVAGLHHHVEAGLDEFLSATAQHGLLAEEVGLGLVLERGLDDARAGAADALGVRQRERLALVLGILVDRDQTRHALAVDELTAHQVTGTLRGHHADGDVGRRLDQVEMDVEAVTEEQRVAVLQIGLDVVLEDLSLGGVGRQQHDDVGPLGHLGRCVHVEPLLGDLRTGLRSVFEADLHLHAGVAQAERVGVALAAVADDADLAALDDRQVRVVVVEHLNWHS